LNDYLLLLLSSGGLPSPVTNAPNVNDRRFFLSMPSLSNINDRIKRSRANI